MLADLKAYVAREISQNNTLTHGKLQRCQTRRSGMYTTAEIMQPYDLLKFAIARSTALLYFKFLLIAQHEVPFINTSEATKRSSDQTVNGKCTNVTNRWSCVLVIFQKRVPVFHRGFKHEKTDESTRPQAECFYCFRVFETPMKHEARVFEITSPTKEN